MDEHIHRLGTARLPSLALPRHNLLNVTFNNT